MQRNHYAVDSLLFDGFTKTIALFQITINENHEIHYLDIIGFINKDYQMKLDDDGKRMKKYFDFFKELNPDLVKQFVFQWLTKMKFPAIEEKTKEKQYKLKDGRLFFIFCFSDQLIKEILSQ